MPGLVLVKSLPLWASVSLMQDGDPYPSLCLWGSIAGQAL